MTFPFNKDGGPEIIVAISQLPLVVAFAGQPYVDVRASINSFVPSSISSDIGSQIVEYALERLRKYPELHDKIEFDLIPTAYVFDFNQRTQSLLEDTSLSNSDIDIWRNARTGGISYFDEKTN